MKVINVLLFWNGFSFGSERVCIIFISIIGNSLKTTFKLLGIRVQLLSGMRGCTVFYNNRPKLDYIYVCSFGTSVKYDLHTVPAP